MHVRILIRTDAYIYTCTCMEKVSIKLIDNVFYTPMYAMHAGVISS